MGLGRKLRKNREREAYARFSKLWREERRLQISATSIEVPVGEPSEEGTQALRRVPSGQRLGRKPTKAMYVDLVRNAEARARVQPREVQEFVDDEEIDLEWKEQDVV